MQDSVIREAFVDLADTLVTGYEVEDFLEKLAGYCTDAVGGEAAGVLLVHPSGELSVVAASTEKMHALELFEMQQDEGPCRDAIRHRVQVVVTDLTETHDRWPRFTPKALELGFRAALACPLRLRDDVVGALNLFRATAGPFREEVAWAQALADVATIGLLQERTIAEADRRAEQLQFALESRVVIEQAKGIVAERLGVDMTAAFQLIRDHARRHNMRLRDLSEAIVEGRLDTTRLR